MVGYRYTLIYNSGLQHFSQRKCARFLRVSVRLSHSRMFPLVGFSSFFFLFRRDFYAIMSPFYRLIFFTPFLSSFSLSAILALQYLQKLFSLVFFYFIFCACLHFAGWPLGPVYITAVNKNRPLTLCVGAMHYGWGTESGVHCAIDTSTATTGNSKIQSQSSSFNIGQRNLSAVQVFQFVRSLPRAWVEGKTSP